MTPITTAIAESNSIRRSVLKSASAAPSTGAALARFAAWQFRAAEFKAINEK
jgi:hypothetical protein